MFSLIDAFALVTSSLCDEFTLWRFHCDEFTCNRFSKYRMAR